MTQIPIVDLEPWWGTADDRAAVGRAIDAAAREFGFFQIVGHRLPHPHIAAMVAASSEFFALPTEIKRQYTPADPAVNRGYAASGTEALSYSIGIDAPPDLFEAFNIGEDVVDYADPFYAAHQHGVFAPNIWPDAPADFRSALVGYFQSARKLALTLTDMFAVGQQVRAERFEAYGFLADDALSTRVVLLDTLADARHPAGHVAPVRRRQNDSG